MLRAAGYAYDSENDLFFKQLSDDIDAPRSGAADFSESENSF